MKSSIDCPLLALAVVLTFSSVSAFAQPTFTEQGLSVLGGANLDARSTSLADIDGDGDLDLFFQVSSGVQQLFRNNMVDDGTLTFTNVSSMLPASLVGNSWSAAWGDYDGDGKVDAYVGTRFGGILMKNNWPAPFSDVSAATNLNAAGWHQNIAWNNIDNDLDLDMLITMEGPQKHEVYLQEPAGSFLRVGADVGFQAPVGTNGYGMAIGDTDSDGDLDVYISTCRAGNNIRNNFFENRFLEPAASFVDIADTNGTQYTPNSYGAEFHDFDDDGDLDLFMVGAGGNPSKIWRNEGSNLFADVDTLTGHPLLTHNGRDFNGARAVDYDNDGDLDLYFHDNEGGAGGINSARRLFRNDGAWQFIDVTAAEGLSETNKRAFDSVWGDIDLDGDQDLIAPTDVTTGSERLFISNAATNGNHWLYVNLAGPTENTTGIGATIYATLNASTPQERTLRRDANTNAGTFNQSDLPIHFGLGGAAEVDLLRIRWPDGAVQMLANVAANQHITIRYAEVPEPTAISLALFVLLVDFRQTRLRRQSEGATLNQPRASRTTLRNEASHEASLSQIYATSQ